VIRLARVALVALTVTLTPVVVVLAVFDPEKSGWGVAWVGYLLVGSVIVWQRPTNAIGWLLSSVGAGFGLTVLAQWFLGSSFGPGPRTLELVASPLPSTTWLALIALVTLFPEGRSTTRLQSVIVRALVALAAAVGILELVGETTLGTGRANPLHVGGLESITRFVMDGPGFLVVPALLAASLVSVARRYRASRGTERLQFRWLIASVAVSVVAIVALFAGQFAPGTVSGLVGVLALDTIPVAVGVAVLRYHLYDIDRIISRTTAYALVTGLALAAFGVVVMLGSSVAPGSSSLTVAVATLTSAALFSPLLRWVRTAVDRRFDRAHYDAQHTVDRFGSQMRTRTDPDLVARDLLSVIDSTMAPSRVGLWLSR
jgi:hypothetical protein